MENFYQLNNIKGIKIIRQLFECNFLRKKACRIFLSSLFILFLATKVHGQSTDKLSMKSVGTYLQTSILPSTIVEEKKHVTTPEGDRFYQIIAELPFKSVYKYQKKVEKFINENSDVSMVKPWEKARENIVSTMLLLENNSGNNFVIFFYHIEQKNKIRSMIRVAKSG